MSIIADPITAALNELRFTIPIPILEKVFIQRSERWRQKHHSLNERIMEEVIRPRVLQDCNIAYGQEHLVDLSLAEGEYVNNYSTVYRIPKELTQGRSILSALNVVFGVAGSGSLMGGYASTGTSTLTTGGQAIASAHENIPVTSTHNVQLVGENTVLVRDTLRAAGNMYLRCILENDDRMTHLHYKAIPVLKELVTYAVKSYIYTQYRIEMDMGELSGGQELGTFKSIIDEYSDAEQNYQDCLREKYPRAAVSTDHTAMQRYVKSIIGGFR